MKATNKKEDINGQDKEQQTLGDLSIVDTTEITTEDMFGELDAEMTAEETGTTTEQQ